MRTVKSRIVGMLGYMSSRVVFALLDCLQSSHDTAVQFDSRPGLKFLVQKVSKFNVAANLYRQAGIARTVYTHVLVELCMRLDDLSVHKIRQVLAENCELWQDLTQTVDMVNCLSFFSYFVYVVQWHSGKALIVGTIPTGTKLRNNLVEVVHTYVLLSPSSITWYWSKDGDVLRLGR